MSMISDFDQNKGYRTHSCFQHIAVCNWQKWVHILKPRSSNSYI